MAALVDFLNEGCQGEHGEIPADGNFELLIMTLSGRIEHMAAGFKSLQILKGGKRGSLPTCLYG